MKINQNLVLICLLVSSLISLGGCRTSETTSSTSKNKTTESTTVENSDYFLPKDDKKTVEKAVGEADFKFENDKDETQVRIEEKKENLLKLSLKDFSKEHIFVYIDDALMSEETNSGSDLSVSLSEMVYAMAPGEHILSLVQYEDNKEENKIINKVSKKYEVISEK
ncbi:hypothetical protein [Vagococcus hydrophili]|uniref:Lipoprotein n=1 Tax=Vagococcus hydrophili TaxID=2714947 RepID=A0A6G8AQX7_9ENTE|nr:hypothetical protein [Vagococcus hydrophili]QIL47390.1 hypothetical protein G7082_02005 [Vagococcus hydrophili]